MQCGLKNKGRNLTIQKLNISLKMASGIPIRSICKAIKCPRITGNVANTRPAYEAQRTSSLSYRHTVVTSWMNNHVHHYHRPHVDKQNNYMQLICLSACYSSGLACRLFTCGYANKRTDRHVTDQKISGIHDSLQSQVCVWLISRHSLLSATTPAFAQTGVWPLTLDGNNCHKVTQNQSVSRPKQGKSIWTGFKCLRMYYSDGLLLTGQLRGRLGRNKAQNSLTSRVWTCPIE